MAGRRRRSSAASLGGKGRWMVTGVAGAAIGWLVIASSVANAVRDVRPAVALRMMPGDARAKARAAELAAFRLNVRPADLAQARGLARGALAGDVTLASAWRTLALVGPQRPVREPDVRLLHVAANLSRRDSPTQIALIETEVGRGNVAGALRHYDYALSTAPRNDPLLMPILVGAAGEPSVRVPLARTLRRAPLWRRRFYTTMANLQVAPPVYAGLLAEMRRYGPLEDDDIFRSVAGYYAQAEQFGPAWSIYRSLQPGQPPRVPLLRNGTFAAENATPPFDWQLFPGDALEVEQDHRNAAGPRLLIRSPRGDAGTAARQLLALPAGRYAIAFRYGPLPDLRAPTLYRNVTCPGGADTKVIRSDEIRPARKGRSVVAFEVPAARCAVQWLEFGVQPSTNDSATGAYITDVRIQRLGA